MSDTDTFERFKAKTVELLSVSPEQVTKEASFADDLEADSLDLTELVMALEEEFDIEVDEDDLEDIRTVGDAFALVERLVAAKT
jgi:acyl carrier protein